MKAILILTALLSLTGCAALVGGHVQGPNHQYTNYQAWDYDHMTYDAMRDRREIGASQYYNLGGYPNRNLWRVEFKCYNNSVMRMDIGKVGYSWTTVEEGKNVYIMFPGDSTGTRVWFEAPFDNMVIYKGIDRAFIDKFAGTGSTPTIRVNGNTFTVNMAGFHQAIAPVLSACNI